MTELKCTDRDLGALLFAYELGALSEEKADRFEVHLMECESCLARLRELSDHTHLLREDSRTRQGVYRIAVDAARSESSWQRMKARLWPQGPVVFKPAVAYLLLLVLLYPAYLGLHEIPGTREVSPVHTLSLLSTRSAIGSSVALVGQTDLVLSVVYRDFREDGVYRVRLSRDDGETLWSDDAYRGFDDRGIGSVFVPGSLLEAGGYAVEVVDIADTSGTRQVYPFTVRR